MPNSVMSARTALLLSIAGCCGVLGVWLLASGTTVDTLGLVSFLARFVHVAAAVVWLGMIWFVNFIQLAALAETDDAGRALLLKLIMPRVALTFRRASHLTMASGVVLLAATGYILDRWVFSSSVYVPGIKMVLLGFGILAALFMWGAVHLVIWPGLRMLTGDVSATDQMKLKVRQRVAKFARLNLILGLPVTFVMVAAAHL